jgi:hypothetical protein
LSRNTLTQYVVAVVAFAPVGAATLKVAVAGRLLTPFDQYVYCTVTVAGEEFPIPIQ